MADIYFDGGISAIYYRQYLSLPRAIWSLSNTKDLGNFGTEEITGFVTRDTLSFTVFSKNSTNSLARLYHPFSAYNYSSEFSLTAVAKITTAGGHLGIAQNNTLAFNVHNWIEKDTISAQINETSPVKDFSCYNLPGAIAYIVGSSLVVVNDTLKHSVALPSSGKALCEISETSKIILFCSENTNSVCNRFLKVYSYTSSGLAQIGQTINLGQIEDGYFSIKINSLGDLIAFAAESYNGIGDVKIFSLNTTWSQIDRLTLGGKIKNFSATNSLQRITFTTLNESSSLQCIVNLERNDTGTWSKLGGQITLSGTNTAFLSLYNNDWGSSPFFFTSQNSSNTTKYINTYSGGEAPYEVYIGSSKITGFSNLRKNLFAFYNFNNPSPLNDSSGNNRHLSSNGSVISGQGVINESSVIDVSGNFLVIPNNFQPGVNAAISLWVKIPTLYDFFPIVSSQSGTLDVRGDSLGRAYFKRNTTSPSLNQFFKPNQWTHLCFCFSQNKFTVFKNSQLISDITVDINLIGSIYLGYNLIGAMDSVGLWSRTLSGEEVMELYNFGRGLEL